MPAHKATPQSCARFYILALGVKFQFWIQDSHPIELSTPEMITQKLAYIHSNPVTAGFVLEPTFWKDSSAAFYEKEETALLKLKNIFG